MLQQQQEAERQHPGDDPETVDIGEHIGFALHDAYALADRVEIRIGSALETLAKIAAAKEGPFDLVFIDADKQGYPAYLAWAERHLRVGGILLADNAFAFGHIHETTPVADAQAVASMRAFADRLARGGRFRATMIPTAEGLAMGVKVR